jgi:uncharacterized protein (DUF2237 family)
MKHLRLLLLLVSTLNFAQNQTLKQQNCLIKKETNTAKLNKNKMKTQEKNVLGEDLELASLQPLTGFYRDGFCSTGTEDAGIHVVAAVMTDAFLNYSKSQGNDLITPNLKYGFPGLLAGDVWCLCANRWKEALKNGVAPPVILRATNQKALDIISLNDLKLNIAK